MTKLKNATPTELFERSVHLIGRSTIFTCILLALSVPLMVWYVFGLFPPLKPFISGILTVSAFMIPLSMAEIFAFYPILGTSGLYISYTTGNISNLKLPCAAIGMEAAEVKPATREGDIISTIAMSGSVIVCEIVLLIGVLLLVPLTRHLSHPLLQPAFNMILPALFGALGAYFILKNPRLAGIPLIFGLLASFFHINPALGVPVCVLISVLGAKYLYKKGMINA